MILAGDIGGTHTRLALFHRLGELRVLEFETYASREASSLEEIVQRFISSKRPAISIASFAIAGPIRQGVCQTTNLPWEIHAESLRKAFQISSVHLYNDLQAHANGLKVLQSEELYILQKGKRQVGNQAFISAGTGLGEAGLFWNGTKHFPFASEGGHVDFAPRNTLEIELFQTLQTIYGHVSYERLVSGPGIYQIYQFLADTKRIHCPSAMQEAVKHEDPSRVISEYGLLHKDPGCIQALHLFLSLYGGEAGNMALKLLALGGVFIGGGIALRLLELFKESPFLLSFRDKGRFQELLTSIPIYIVLNEQTALLGAALFGRDELCSNTQ